MKNLLRFFLIGAAATALAVGCGKKDDGGAGEKAGAAKPAATAKAGAEKEKSPDKADEKAEAKPADEKKADEKPADEKKADEKPADEKKADEKPADEKKADEKPADEKKADEKPADGEKAAEAEGDEPVKDDKKDPLAAPADVKEPPKDAPKSASGLAWKVISEGKGEATPAPEDTVKVHYTGWTTDGKMFDSSVKRGQPATFPLNGVIAGWTEGVGMMKVGEKRRLWIPESLAYKGRPGAPAGMLVFDVELLEIIAAPKAPSDVAAPPADADTTATGLASKVISPGTGSVKPQPTDTVKVHYTGWTTDGKMFDSSVVRGQPATFPLNRVIPGWTEGVGLMVQGEKRRLWIPEDLAYKGRPGAPAGMLVFDVELLEIAK